MICNIYPNPSIDLPKMCSPEIIQVLKRAFEHTRLVVRSCANCPVHILDEHKRSLDNLLMAEPNAEKNRLNRKRKLFYGARVKKYPLYFLSPNNKLLCIPRYLALELTNGRIDKDLTRPGEPLSPKEAKKPNTIKLYDYQTKIVRALLERFRRPGPQGAYIQMGCGLGKTLTTIFLLLELGVRALIVTPQDNVLTQWIDRLNTAAPGCSIGRVQGSRFDVKGHGVVLCMIHTLSKRQFPPGAFDAFGLVVFDEVHHISAEMFSKCVRKLPARCRLGLTATPKRKDGLGHVISWLVGPRICRVVRKNQSVRVEVVNETTDYGPPILNKKTKRPCYISMLRRLGRNQKRTDLIARTIAREVLQAGRTVLVASSWAKKKHLGFIHEALVPLLTPTLEATQKLLYPFFECMGFRSLAKSTIMAFLFPTIGYFVGEQTKKNKLKRKQEVCLHRVVLTTFKMGEEAMDIPTINTIVLAMPKKGMEQMVGRITRGANLGEKLLYPKVIDIVDTRVRICQNMYAHRKREYKQLGFYCVGDDLSKLGAKKRKKTTTKCTQLMFQFLQKKKQKKNEHPRSI